MSTTKNFEKKQNAVVVERKPGREEPLLDKSNFSYYVRFLSLLKWLLFLSFFFLAVTQVVNLRYISWLDRTKKIH